MANKKSDSIDENAFQALEAALSIDFDGDEAAAPVKARSQARAPEAPLSDSNPRSATKKTIERRSARAGELNPEPAPKAPAFAPANDGSRRTPSAILKSLDGASLTSALRNAAIVSALWVLGALGLTQLLYGSAIWQAPTVADIVAMPGVVAIVVGTFLPIMLFFAFAIMMARAHDLRNAARSMAEVALRLAEPETIASERIMTVGQAVRREVSAMNEGIERTIARATELETLVHSEVTALERSYTDNELRVRGLVHELGAERDAIVNHAERIRSSIVGAHEQLKEELSLATEEISVRLQTSGEAFASMIDMRAATIMEKSDAAVTALGSLLAHKTDNMVQTLAASGMSLSSEFDTQLQSLTSTLTQRGRELLGEFATRASTLDANTEKLNAALNDRARQLNETLVERTRDIAETLKGSESSITSSLDDVLSRLNSSLDERGRSFRQSLQASADDAIVDLDLRSGLFEDRFQTTIGQINATFDQRVAEFASAFDQRSGSLDSKLMESLAGSTRP